MKQDQTTTITTEKLQHNDRQRRCFVVSERSESTPCDATPSTTIKYFTYRTTWQLTLDQDGKQIYASASAEHLLLESLNPAPIRNDVEVSNGKAKRTSKSILDAPLKHQPMLRATTMAELWRVLRMTPRRPYRYDSSNEWRLINPPEVGQFASLPSTHGTALCTDGVHVIVETTAGVIIEGHCLNWQMDYDVAATAEWQDKQAQAQATERSARSSKRSSKTKSQVNPDDAAAGSAVDPRIALALAGLI